MITVGAMIGAGKSSLTKILAEELGSTAFYESVDNNPILPLFYTATEEEIQTKRYPFLLQLYFLDTRFKSIKQALTHNDNILDRSIYEDLYFCRVNRDLGRISELEFSIYSGLLENMLEELDELPKKAPDLLIYLRGSFETILSRIAGRGREYEVSDDLRDYYYTLWSGYDDYMFNEYNASEILVIDIDKYDYVNNPEDREVVVKMVKDKLAELRGQEVEEVNDMEDTFIDRVSCTIVPTDRLEVKIDRDGDVKVDIIGLDNHVYMTQERAVELANKILSACKGEL